MKNPFRFGGRWSWMPVRPGRVYVDPDKGPMMNVHTHMRLWHPGAWLFLVSFVLKHVRISVYRTRNRA